MPRKNTTKELRDLQAEVQQRLSQVSLLQQEQRELQMQVTFCATIDGPLPAASATARRGETVQQQMQHKQQQHHMAAATASSHGRHLMRLHRKSQPSHSG
jgi:prefoldin subunit 5